MVLGCEKSYVNCGFPKSKNIKRKETGKIKNRIENETPLSKPAEQTKRRTKLVTEEKKTINVASLEYKSIERRRKGGKKDISSFQHPQTHKI